MHWHEFVFSKKPVKRLLRHALFWAAWWLYFSISFYYLQQPPPGSIKPLYVTPGSHLLLKTFFLVILYAFASYNFIYLLLPQMIKGKWLKAVANILLLSSILFAGAHILYWYAFPFVDSRFGHYKPNHFPTQFWPAASLGLVDSLKVIAAAAIIKYVKYWWLKQKESERLERKKINTELQILKAQIHPDFLLTALDNIYLYSLAASPRAPELLLKLSNLLSYMLYDCSQPLVPLEREVEMMKDYIAIEKVRLNDAVETEFRIRGNMMDKNIAPFLLLPFIENIFKYCSSLTEQPWINMDIVIEGDAFTMKLVNGIMSDDASLKVLLENGLAKVQKRLTLIYPQKHELKVSHEREMLIIFLKIQLSETAFTQPIENEKEFIRESTNL